MAFGSCARLYTGLMAVRIAIPEPTSSDPEYNGRALPQYVNALKAAGAEPVVVPLNEPQERVARMLADVQGVLLPGSRYDVDPQRYGEARTPECAGDDPARTAADELLRALKEALLQPGHAHRRGTHVHPAAAGAQVKRNADHTDAAGRRQLRAIVR